MNPLLSLAPESDMVDGRAVGKIFKKNTQLKNPVIFKDSGVGDTGTR